MKTEQRWEEGVKHTEIEIKSKSKKKKVIKVLCSERTFNLFSFINRLNQNVRGVFQKHSDWCGLAPLNLSSKMTGVEQKAVFTSQTFPLTPRSSEALDVEARPNLLCFAALCHRPEPQLSIMKIDLNWDLWLLNGWHRGIFLSREWGSQYGTYKRPINYVRPAYKTFTDWVEALSSGSSALRYCM